MCDEIDLQLGRRLRTRRRLLGLTQEQLGLACGIRFQQIQKYETAANKMSAGMLGRLAKALDIGVGYFFEGLDDLVAAKPPRRRRAARNSNASPEERPPPTRL